MRSEPMSKSRTFEGRTYREVQRSNSNNRVKLQKDDRQWLKANGYRNVGWENVIQLYQKIQLLLEVEDSTLEDLFLEADRIGSKYQTAEEIAAFNQELSEVVNEISDEIDRQFPDTEMESIDFSKKSRKKSNQKTYKTLKS
ncbi:hypothetical protein H6F89_16830 [Cyanobacteria bacterium FACHB-63]|nr:hypothetical protein [Cyanobacteria bacterium FACHB-63]